jgi:uncharacterized RDD family membrane protein YckC
MVIDLLVVSLPAVAVGYMAGPFVGQFAMRFATVTFGRAARSAIRTGELSAVGESLRGTAVMAGQAIAVVFLAIIVVALATLILYTWLTHATFGRTLGKLLFGIEVVCMGNGGRAGYVRCLVRSLVLFGPPLVLVTAALAAVITGQEEENVSLVVIRWVALCGALLMLLPQRRGLHDWLSGTVVSRV